MISVFKKIIRFAQKERANIRKSIIAGFMNAVFNALQFAAIYYVLVRIFNKTIGTKDIAVSLGILLISLAGKMITKYISQLQQTHAGYFMAADKRIEIGEKLKKVPMGFFSDFSLGKLTTLSTTTLSLIEAQVPLLLVLMLGGLLNTSIFVLSLFFFNVKIGLIAVGGMTGFFIVTACMEKRSRKNAHQIHEAQQDLTKQVLTTVQGMSVIKSYNLAGENNKELHKAFDDNCRITMGLEKTMTPYIAAQRIIIGAAISLMVYFSFKLYLKGAMLLPDAIMSMIASFIIFEGLKGAGSLMAILRITENAIDSLNYLETMPEIQEGEKTQTTASAFGNSKTEIEFKNVSFRYDEKNILNNVSCKMNEKEITAVVGPSGSGKTTLCNLIARFWDVQGGSISIGGVNIKDLSLEDLMSKISMVFQNVYLFEDTIENNIKFGKPEASREEVIEAAKKAMCHEFIEALPQGYDTLIGEGGASLSGGEKQRLSIARAILKDAPIIIFDEATANIDPENEDKLRLAIEALTANKTIIMIAHRLKTIRNADKILVLHDGTIEQSGTHEELTAQGGLYKNLITAKNESAGWKLSKN
ncbi:ABC transporter ATP-binding protein [Treponema sp. OMZ 792]|uniref:ABC transporter ATP-binding protein n=1 Tax=unclassified Treponema TaxID=2638727 RepID=UPI0020A53380|nr:MULTISPECIES: ABC transporter ATP-binding protein [unclassified Treponema]UTC74421.1 ABC transporter ATP-binding protein [Treponema sp. OMZ 792]UTC80818.1 ABC transporter ATP-binding protein [Treponema sp. OMZ 798]